jgi:23S rRNA-/tRNA-specific pseudouridylate synthase
MHCAFTISGVLIFVNSFFYFFSFMNIIIDSPLEFFVWGIGFPMGNDLKKFLHPKAALIDCDPQRIVALYKPCEVLSIPNREGGIVKNALIYLPYNLEQRCYFLPDGRKFFLLNRLDAPTSGVLIGCFSLELARTIRRTFLEQKVHKVYRAIVLRKKIASRGEFRDVLQKSSENNHLRVKIGQGDLAITKYTVEKEFEKGDFPLLLLRLEPITGRTHQLRVQFSLRKMPIVGDKIYGDFALNKKLGAALPQKRLYLQSCSISFQYEFHGQKYSFSSEL